MRASFKIDPATLITEVLTIVVGILLALAANEWNNQRLQHNKLEAILQIVAQELEYNQKVISVIHEKNTSALAILEKDNDEEDSQIVPGMQVRVTAWQTLLSSGVIENLSLPLLKSLHEHYAMIEVYRTLSYQTVQTILSTQAIVGGISKDMKQAKSNALYVDSVRILVELESQLLSNFEQVNTALKRYSN